MAKPPLTKEKQKWAQGRKVNLLGVPLQYNAAQQMRYVQALQKLVKQMTDETKVQLVRLFRGEIADDYFDQQAEASAMDASLASQARILTNKLMTKFTQLFASSANTLADRMLTGATTASQANLHTSLKELSGGLSLKTSMVPAGMEDVVSASISENVSLIKSIPSQYFTNITGAVMRSITTGNGLADLLPQINKFAGETSRRTKNLALDQTRKAYNSINKQRMQGLGVKQFKWLHTAGGQKPRESHIKISGHVFNFENLEEQQAALGVPEKDQGIPGHPINCKCVMIPVIKFDDEM